MREISQLHLPIKRPEDVIPYLGSPGHWRDGRSAKLIAESWFAADGLPEMVRVTLGRCPPDQVSRFAGAELVDAFLERCTELGDGSTPSQTDVLAILRLPDEIAVMAIEGKVDESFGPLTSEWLGEAASTRPVVEVRQLHAQDRRLELVQAGVVAELLVVDLVA